MKIKTYNQKGFLLPESIRSCALYHAKIMPDGEYYFRIHDCLGGVRLRGNVTDPVDRVEAVAKLQALSRAAWQMAAFIEENYIELMKEDEDENAR